MLLQRCPRLRINNDAPRRTGRSRCTFGVARPCLSGVLLDPAAGGANWLLWLLNRLYMAWLRSPLAGAVYAGKITEQIGRHAKTTDSFTTRRSPGRIVQRSIICRASCMAMKQVAVKRGRLDRAECEVSVITRMQAYWFFNSSSNFAIKCKTLK